jgi:hypothetical protein
VYANSKNIKGYGAKSARVSYIAGASAWPAAPVATNTPVAPAPAAALTCATGGTCVVGNTGPGGGIVYYVNTTGFSCGPTLAAICNYLEVAPSDWNTGPDPQKLWVASNLIDVSGVTNDSLPYNNALGIGLGYKNSNAMGLGYAAGAARAYSGGFKNDWYLPTTAELNLLCQWGRGVTQAVTTLCLGGTLNSGTGVSGGFVAGYYWSSSEQDIGSAWMQDFAQDGQYVGDTATSRHVRPVRAFARTCANGGPCVVGDRGPGGGIVYYVSAANFTSTGSTCNTACKYLEVAPATWQSAGASVSNDLTYVWSTDIGVETEQDATTLGTESGFPDEKQNWKIGKGLSNTNLMKVSGATSTAQAKVLAYAGNSTAGQWFIPSMNELNELCKYARGQTTGDLTVACVAGSGIFKSTENVGSDLGGFAQNTYWSSSERNSSFAWYQSLLDGEQRNGRKSYPDEIRPVRAF